MYISQARDTVNEVIENTYGIRMIFAPVSLYLLHPIYVDFYANKITLEDAVDGVLNKIGTHPSQWVPHLENKRPDNELINKSKQNEKYKNSKILKVIRQRGKQKGAYAVKKISTITRRALRGL